MNNKSQEYIKLSELGGIYDFNEETLIELVLQRDDLGIDSAILWGILCDNASALREVNMSVKAEILEDLSKIRKAETQKSKTPKRIDKKVDEEVAHPLIDATGIESITIEEALEVYNRWLSLERDVDITIPFAYVIANYTNTDPGCLAIIAPSGSYKTEVLRSLGEDKNDIVYPLDNLTSHTLVSGLVKARDVIPDLEGRLITIKDFTSILSKQKDERTAIFSDIREMLDGYLNREFGSGKKVSYKGIHSSWLIGSTNALEGYYTLNATLGQRMIFFRPINNGEKAREKAGRNRKHGKELREDLKAAATQCLKPLIAKIQREGDGNESVPEEAEKQIGKYCDFVAIARTLVRRDFKGHISEEPEPEYGTRLVKEMLRIIEAHAMLYRRAVTEDDLQVGLVLLHNNIPSTRVRLIRKLAEKPIFGFRSGEIATSLSLGSDMTRERLTELLVLGIIYKESLGGSKGDRWVIRPEWQAIIQQFLDFETGFARGVEPGVCIYISRKHFSSDLTIKKVHHNNSIYINTTDILKDKENSKKVFLVHTPPDLPPLQCSSCGQEKVVLYRYLDKLYCAGCLEDDFEKESKDIDSITHIQRPFEGVCNRCSKKTKLDHIWVTNGEDNLICSECADELKEAVK